MVTKISISGVSSEVGKTTLLCSLLRELPGWEAIKMTRGHYRSCGKDPHACCVSHLLGDQPLIRSGFKQTYVSDKDTGRYWEAGAKNVHWVIVTDNQVEAGIQLALERVKAPGVLIEGNSFLEFVDVDFGLLVTRNSNQRTKRSTKWALEKASALFTFDEPHPMYEQQPMSDELQLVVGSGPKLQGRQAEARRTLPVYTLGDFPTLVAMLTRIQPNSKRAAL